jgi:hypothetical protein
LKDHGTLCDGYHGFLGLGALDNIRTLGRG